MSRDEGAEIETRREIPAPRDAPQPTPSMEVSAFDPPGERFEIGDELGRGGMGRVVAATDRALAREVAIKQALSDDTSDLARFEREVRITARLEHPAIVAIHDAGRDDHGRPFYVMRRIDGEQLSDRVAAATTPRERLALVPHVLAAVDAAAFAHARKIIHRDIKPANILIGAYGETLLIDWGLARELDEAELPGTAHAGSRDTGLTVAGGVFGTPGYMAPEQARGEPADERADVYALGATLLHVLTGEKLLGSSSETAWLAQAVKGLAPVATVSSEVPRELIAIVDKAMGADRETRYRNAGELAADLRAFLAGQLVAAHHYTTRERLARYVRKHRVALAIAGAALIAVAMIAAISIGNVIEERDLARDARADAERERQIALKERGTATDRSEVMLLDRASTLTATEPTRAFALLRQLPPTSRHLARARDIAETAAFRGVSRGMATPIEGINFLEFTTDGKSLVVAGEHGEIFVIDVATGDHRIFDVGARTAVALLIDRDRLVFSSFKGGLSLVDFRTGKRVEIDPAAKAESLWRVDDDRFRYLDPNRRVVAEHSLRTGSDEVVATDVRSAFGFGDRLLVGDGKVLRLLGGPRPIEISKEPGFGNSGVTAANVTLDRFAVASTKTVVEWDLAGAETRRWDIAMVSRLEYGNDGRLYASSANGSLLSLLRKGNTELLRRTNSMWWKARVKNGVAFLDGDGRLYALIGAHPITYSFDHPRSRTLAVSRDSRHLAMGSVDGTVRWFDLDLMLPETHLLAPGTLSCWIDDEHVYVAQQDALLAVSRRTGASRTIATYSGGFPFGCVGKIGPSIVLISARETLFLNTETTTLDTLPLHGLVDQPGGHFVFPRANQLLEYDPSTRVERALITASAPVLRFASRGRWAAATTKSTAYRIDRQTGAITTMQIPEVDVIALRDNGVLAYGRARELVEWDGTSTHVNFSLPHGGLESLSQVADGWGIRLEDGSLWFSGPDGLIQRAPPNRINFFGLGPGDFAWRLAIHQKLYRMHLRTGEQLVLEFPLKMLTRSSENLAVAATDTSVIVIEDRSPRDPAKLFAWIDATTNAYLDPATNALYWRGEVKR